MHSLKKLITRGQRCRMHLLFRLLWVVSCWIAQSRGLLRLEHCEVRPGVRSQTCTSLAETHNCVLFGKTRDNTDIKEQTASAHHDVYWRLLIQILGKST